LRSRLVTKLTARVPEAQAVTSGSRSVVVGDLDTGIDWTHPDLAANVDFADSASCESGAPDTSPAAWFDELGHGTHTAGTIAAAQNGIGIVGVAPDVRIAAVKTTSPDGFIFPEMVVCGFMWAGAHGFAVTNNSYFADPWYFNCRNDPEQRAIWIAEQRAIRWAMNQGVAVVAALGNFSDDLAHPTTDVISPDTDAAPPSRDVTNACAVIPAEIPGVIGVSGVGPAAVKSYFSNYGVGVADVTAPAGDELQGGIPDGWVLSSIPADFGSFSSRSSPRSSSRTARAGRAPTGRTSPARRWRRRT
jgi:subtilisin family serine protease